MKKEHIPVSVRNEIAEMPVIDTGTRKPVLEVIMKIVEVAFAVVAIGAIVAFVVQLCS